MATVGLSSISIRTIMLNTYKNFETRFDNMERDVLPSKLRIIDKKVYTKDRKNMFDEKLEIISYSNPQYRPYNKHARPGTKQRKYQHHYNITIQLSKDAKGEYSYDSLIRWRVGSFSSIPKVIPQVQVKTVHKDTKERLIKRISKMKLTESEKKAKLKVEIDRIKKNGKYLCDGDFIANEKGINLDNYYRNFYVQNMFGALYGPLAGAKSYKGISVPFFCKHTLAVMIYLIAKGHIKK